MAFEEKVTKVYLPLSLPQTGPLLKSSEVESHSEGNIKITFCDSSFCVYIRDSRYVSTGSSGIRHSPQEENNKDSNIGIIGYQPVAEPKDRIPK